jgi:hypothetical protein
LGKIRVLEVEGAARGVALAEGETGAAGAISLVLDQVVTVYALSVVIKNRI